MTHTGKEPLWTSSFTLTMVGMLFLFIPFALYMPVMPAYLLEELHLLAKLLRASSATPRLLPAPGLWSMMNCWPKWRDSQSQRMRPW